MNQFRYVLEGSIINGSRVFAYGQSRQQKHYCQRCQKKKFVRYIDIESREYLPEKYGRCDRQDNCAYELSPYIDGYNKIEQKSYAQKPRIRVVESKQLSTINIENFKSSLSHYEQNNFVKYLQRLFDADVVEKLVSNYFIGTSNHWKGSTVFYQIDLKRRIRAGKIMLYNAVTGARTKKTGNYTTWVHSVLRTPGFNLQQCFFGEHLLHDTKKPVAIVESEKTAIIASHYLPQNLWIASGGANGLNEAKCEILEGRKVLLWPDLGKYDMWSKKAKELTHIASFKVSDLLEKKATKEQRIEGFDIADYLVKLNHSEFSISKQHEKEQKQEKAIHIEDLDMYELIPDFLFSSYEEPKVEVSSQHQIVKKNPEQERISWKAELNELEQFFDSFNFTSEPVKLNDWTTIIDARKFVEFHLATLKKNDGNRYFLPQLQQLIDLKEIALLHNEKNNII